MTAPGEPATEVFPEGSYQNAPLAGKLLIAVVGPVSNLLLGVVLLSVAVWSGAPQLRHCTAEESAIHPCAVGGLCLEQTPSTWKGQDRLFRDLGKGLVRRYILLAPLEGWGGFFGTFITSGAAGQSSPPAAATCLGIVLCLMSLGNLLPLGILNGGQVIVACLTSLLGDKRTDRLVFPYMMGSLLYVLLLMGRGIWADLMWLRGLL